MEIFAFLFLTAVVMPALAVAWSAATDSPSGSIRWWPVLPGRPRAIERKETSLLRPDRHQSPRSDHGPLLVTDQRVVAPPGCEIASILVQARPEQLDEVEAAIVALAGCEIHGRDPRGKLVVVVEAPDAGSLGSTLNTIALLPHVHSASLVFHAIDAG